MSALARMISKPGGNCLIKAPIVVLHGFLGYSRSWTSMSRRIAEEAKREVHVLDLRNHGHSPHYESFHFNDLVSDLMEYVEVEIKHPSCIVMGHSLGGLVLCQFLQRNPKKVSSGIVVDISPAVLHPDKLNEFIGYIDAMMESVPCDSVITLKDVDERLAQKIKDPKMRSFLITNLSRQNGTLGWLPNLPVLRKFLKSGELNFQPLSTFSTTPTHFIFGGESSYYQTKDRVRNIEKVFGAPLPAYVKQTVMESCHHLPHIENSSQFLKVVTEYLGHFP